MCAAGIQMTAKSPHDFVDSKPCQCAVRTRHEEGHRCSIAGFVQSASEAASRFPPTTDTFATYPLYRGVVRVARRRGQGDCGEVRQPPGHERLCCKGMTGVFDLEGHVVPVLAVSGTRPSVPDAP